MADAANVAELNEFLAGVEKRAFRMAQIAVKDTEEALDIVQDTMLTLVRKYADKPAAEWRPLFYRILKNRITDSHRRNVVRRKVIAWFAPSSDNGEPLDPIENAPGRESDTPDVRMALDGAGDALSTAIGRLPNRQREAFMLRVWEGLSVAQTSVAMRCSEGSVKTHYSRAVHSLRELLEDYRS